jgi:hypothetical protein
MNSQEFIFTKPNSAWILHREEIDTTVDGNCNVYVLLDADSGFLFGQEISTDLPAAPKIQNLLKAAYKNAGDKWPQKVLILKKDPYAEILGEICGSLKIPLELAVAKDLAPFVREFRISFRQFTRGGAAMPDQSELSDEEQRNLEAFIPDTYGPCACGSGKKFKFCCYKAYKDITFAMCAAEEGNRVEALKHMKQAEDKVGRTAEIVCRIAICWSFFDMNKSREYMREALSLNPNHPRTNYVLGIDAVAAKQYVEAIKFYETAVEHYPKEDKFHLNETYNNLGTAYYQLNRYQEAKDSWEKALVLLPSDRMVKTNLVEHIYENKDVPKPVREISPFIAKFFSGNLR